ncbi:hypothetical protein [Falsiroseomonas ponticola]|uniref:hypothetical protein n=1 Tax=Falsiroseomonas ponticola TaxID=2786951 RepID=UPI0019315E67|nr:hypothetical protein [Roseomonas ponticola]
MRLRTLLALPVGLLMAGPAAAQHWNDSGPGRDLMSSTAQEFDSFRQRMPAQPRFTPTTPGVPATAAAPRGPIPILDWVPPPPVPAAGTAPRRTGTSTVRRTRAPAPPAAQEPVFRDPAPQPAAVPASATSDAERSLAERERELDRLRRILEEDRLRYQRRQQPQLQ